MSAVRLAVGLRWCRASAASVVVLVACSGAPPVEPATASAAGSVAPPAAQASAPTPSSLPSVVAASEAHEVEPPAPSACPSGMILVDGEYCSEVEQKCLQSWYDKSNKKTVCEVFEPETRCVGSRSEKRFCVDEFAWPNRAGERPEVMNRFHQAQVKCAAIGKRMCTESEWTFACEGPEAKPYPYGYVRDTRKCNGDHPWDGPNMDKVAARDPSELARLWRGVRSGSQPHCVSDFGVKDLPGNNDEVVASESYLLPGFKGKYDSIHTGGPWYRGVRNQCRPKIYTHDEGFYYYFLGFRCCAEPDGTETEPLTPMQRHQGWDFGRVERMAGFTREEVREALARKAKDGHCGCAELTSRRQRIHCNTLCGTTLGPDAEDAVQPPAVGTPPFGAQQRVSAETLERALQAGGPASVAPR